MSYAQALIDAAGFEHPRACGEARIVCLVPSITELLCDLGLAASLVGRTGFCVHPAKLVKAIPKVGGTKDVKLDRVRRLEPTHVIVDVDENRRETAQALGEFVPNIIVTHPQRPTDNLALYRLLGGIFDREIEAETLAARFELALQALQEVALDLPKRDVLYLIWRDPWMTVSPDTYISRTLRLVNLHTVPDDRPQRYPEVDIDDPTLGTDLMLLSSEPYPFREKHVDELRAMGTGGLRPVLIDGEMVSWYGSRAISGLQYLTDFASSLCR